ncbi:MAG TPA: GNAT family N-acetyltransferase, partial [Mycobacterium sp.]|nr:GNAT family N-acetyltransferase [Mycobacterium sp.]
RDRLGARVTTRTRTGFSTPAPADWDRDRLRRQADSLPEGYAIRRVTAPDIPSYVDVAKDFVSNFRSVESYLKHGLGYGVWSGERCVAGCLSFTLANGKLEVEIDTDPAHRRKGLARAVAATLILHCLDAGIEPCWDAHNPESAALAQQLGFTDPTPYEVFVVGAEA